MYLNSAFQGGGNPGFRNRPSVAGACVDGRKRAKGERPGAHLRPAHGRRERLPPLVQDLRPRVERRVCLPGRDRAQRRPGAGIHAHPKRSGRAAEAAHDQSGSVRLLSSGRFRTVQRWEREEHLPVHRLQHDKLGSVYAYRSELDAWWASRGDSLRRSIPQPEPDSSVVVLPFANFSGEKDQECFCEGMAEELVGTLGKIKGLRVASRRATIVPTSAKRWLRIRKTPRL